jgi:hypothetical protein
MPAHQPSRQTRANRIQKSTDKKRGRLQDQSPEDAPLLEARTHTIVYLTGPRASKPHPTTHQPQQQQTEEEDPTNLQELGMNLSGSQDKPTLALTIPRSNQVVYKGFPSATQFLSIQALRTRPASRPRPAFSTQVMIRTRPKTRLLSNPITQPTTFRRSIQRGFRLRGVQPLSHA